LSALNEKNSKDTKIPARQKKLLADTGSPYTFISLGNAEKAGGKPTPIEGDKGCNFGDRYNVSDLEMEIEVEDSKGNKIKKTCKEIHACKFNLKFAMELLIRLSLDGILGWDQFDSLGADPAKDCEKTRAFLELREDPPAKKE
jgi:hypothetical protein